MTKKLFNFQAMKTTPETLLRANLRFGSGGMPEGIDWAATPHGERFWFRAFVLGKGQGKRAIARLLKQASDDLYLTRHGEGKISPLRLTHDPRS